MAITYGRSIIVDGSDLASRTTYIYAGGQAVYESLVLEQLRALSSWPAGLAVIHDIDGRCKDWLGKPVVTIKPLVRSGDVGSNALDDLAAAPAGARVPEYCTWAMPGHSDDIKGTGTGAGTTSVILYDPRDCDGRPGNCPDELLLHELVHAMRAGRGVYLCARPDGIDAYDNEEEFFAVLIANIYRAGLHRIPPRANHGSDYRGLRSPAEFWANPLLVEKLVTKLWTEQRSVVQQLARLDYYFNPIRDITGPTGDPVCRKTYVSPEAGWPTVWTLARRTPTPPTVWAKARR